MGKILELAMDGAKGNVNIVWMQDHRSHDHD